MKVKTRVNARDTEIFLPQCRVKAIPYTARAEVYSVYSMTPGVFICTVCVYLGHVELLLVIAVGEEVLLGREVLLTHLRLRIAVHRCDHSAGRWGGVVNGPDRVLAASPFTTSRLIVCMIVVYYIL